MQYVILAIVIGLWIYFSLRFAIMVLEAFLIVCKFILRYAVTLFILYVMAVWFVVSLLGVH